MKILKIERKGVLMYEIDNNGKSGTKHLPCDGGCYDEGAAMETCSLHGRPPAKIWEIVDKQSERLRKLEEPTTHSSDDSIPATVLELIREFVNSNDDCYFDHDGGCQAHGYLSLEREELCPHEDAKRLLRSKGYEI